MDLRRDPEDDSIKFRNSVGLRRDPVDDSIKYRNYFLGSTSIGLSERSGFPSLYSRSTNRRSTSRYLNGVGISKYLVSNIT